MSVSLALGVGVAAGAAATALLCARKGQLRHRAGGERQEQKEEEDEAGDNEVLFFPDSSLDPDMSEEEKVLRYKSVLGGSRPLARMLRHLSSARRTLDICVFMVSSRQMAEAALEGARKRGVRVRLVVDEAQSALKGSQVRSRLGALL